MTISAIVFSTLSLLSFKSLNNSMNSGKRFAMTLLMRQRMIQPLSAAVVFLLCCLFKKHKKFVMYLNIYILTHVFGSMKKLKVTH